MGWLAFQGQWPVSTEAAPIWILCSPQGRWSHGPWWALGGRAALVLWAAGSHGLALQPLYFCCPWMLTERTAGTGPAWGSCPVAGAVEAYPTFPPSSTPISCPFVSSGHRPSTQLSTTHLPFLHLDFMLLTVSFLLPPDSHVKTLPPAVYRPALCLCRWGNWVLTQRIWFAYVNKHQLCK